jgi:hypothetical protein
MSRVHHKVSARSLSAAIGFAVMASAAIAVAKPASADALTDMFLDTLNNSGVSYGDANAASSLGKNACAVLKQPGSDFARVASTVSSSNTISPDMAALFTSIAISTYCPTMFTSLTGGDWLGQLGLLGQG